MADAPIADDAKLYAELWVSLASLLRSYTAAYGLNRIRQATVELGEEQILVRVGDRWLRFVRIENAITWVRENGKSGSMDFTVHGRLRTKPRDFQAEEEQEMDMAAEAWARELMHGE